MLTLPSLGERVLEDTQKPLDLQRSSICRSKMRLQIAGIDQIPFDGLKLLKQKKCPSQGIRRNGALILYQNCLKKTAIGNILCSDWVYHSKSVQELYFVEFLEAALHWRSLHHYNFVILRYVVFLLTCAYAEAMKSCFRSQKTNQSSSDCVSAFIIIINNGTLYLNGPFQHNPIWHNHQ